MDGWTDGWMNRWRIYIDIHRLISNFSDLINLPIQISLSSSNTCFTWSSPSPASGQTLPPAILVRSWVLCGFSHEHLDQG